MGLLVTGLSVASFMVVGCSTQQPSEVQPPQQSPEVQTSEQSLNAQTPQQSANAQIAQQSPSPQGSQKDPDVVYVPTPETVVERMLELAKVTKNDTVYDLGSGDGRVVITAAKKYGAQGVGVELRPELLEEARQNAQKQGVSDRVQFLQQDLFQTDISKATVVTLYLLPDLNVKLRPILFKTLKPGTRIVSHDFDMGEWKPERVEQVQGPNRTHTVYYWVIPEKAPENLQ
jgi:SAM-dependent methyltransferase